jgi:hypothetical protein
MAFDTWTSLVGDPFISITAHYITAPTNDPLRWELKSEQLAFTPLIGNHSGANIGSILIDTINTFGLRAKTGWFTADNATNNDTAIKAVGKELGSGWDPIKHHVR